MNSFIWPPHARAFWTPVLDGLVAGLIAGGIGYCWTGDTLIALGWGLLFFGALWLPARIAWLRLVMRMYTPQPVEDDAPEDEGEQPERETIYASSQDGSHILVLNPPCSASQLWSWCIGIFHNEPTTFIEWVNNQKVFTQAEYTEFRQWLFNKGFAKPTVGNEIQITTEGNQMVEYVFTQHPHTTPPLRPQG